MVNIMNMPSSPFQVILKDGDRQTFHLLIATQIKHLQRTDVTIPLQTLDFLAFSSMSSSPPALLTYCVRLPSELEENINQG